MANYYCKSTASVARGAAVEYSFGNDLPSEVATMNTKLPTRQEMDARIAVVLPAAEKRKLFELAARQNTTVSAMIRAAVAHVANQAA